jgi:hypothetical protein
LLLALPGAGPFGHVIAAVDAPVQAKRLWPGHYAVVQMIAVPHFLKEVQCWYTITKAAWDGKLSGRMGYRLTDICNHVNKYYSFMSSCIKNV